ncbi:MAG: substrate binding domain-containing protein, partial [Pseudomonadota bacterium]|nr:substrate binding domain-containing protein [Pseudomonadota bacterium]
VLASHVPALLRRYPELSLELVSGDGDRDMIEERIDLWVRVGESTHASHVTRRIGTTRPLLVAAPSYIAARGQPRSPADLAAHECIVQHRYGHDNLWRFAGPEGEAAVPVAGRFSADNSAAVLRAALAGVGIAILADVLAGFDVDAGRLCGLLPGYKPAGRPIMLVYPSRRNLSPRVRVVIDFLVEGLIGRTREFPLAAEID